MFCSQCGNEIDSQTAFCKQCGNQIQQTVPSRVTWVFPAHRKFSMLKIIPCNIMFTPDKIILAI